MPLSTLTLSGKTIIKRLLNTLNEALGPASVGPFLRRYPGRPSECNDLLDDDP
jgi:hypothetical protein